MLRLAALSVNFNNLSCNLAFGWVNNDSSKSSRVYRSSSIQDNVVILTGCKSLRHCRTWRFFRSRGVEFFATASRRLGTVLAPFACNFLFAVRR